MRPRNVARMMTRLRKVYWAIMNDIRDYGEDGFGDKPAHMDTVVYWLSHLNPESFQ